MVGDDALGDDDDSVVKSSQDVDTTILFTKPMPNYGDVAFGEQILLIFKYEMSQYNAPFTSHLNCCLLNLLPLY